MIGSRSRNTVGNVNVRRSLPTAGNAANEALDPRKFTSRIGYPWVPDLGDGTYQNPILFADYSDPDVIRDGDDFYLVASSFNCTPGLPILHSHDLVNWTIVNHAVKNLPDPRGVYHTVRHGEGVWAPAIRKHDGKFWIFFPMPDEGIYVVTADDPRGQWSNPHLLVAGRGLIDPCPLWDDGGKAYLVHAYAHSRCGMKHKLCVRPMAVDASQLLGDGQVVFDKPEEQPTLEGPKFLKRDGYYYILAPAGGVENGWQLAMRSRDVLGPYEERVVLEQGSTPINGPHQGGLVEAGCDEWWFVHFQDVNPYGRVVHLQPVSWHDGWPVMGLDHDGNGVGEPVSRHRRPRVACPVQQPAVPQSSDEFDDQRLGLQWQWHANHRDDWFSLSDRPGWLRLNAQHLGSGNLFQSPSVLLQKFPAASFAAETQIDPGSLGDGEFAGLVVMGREYGSLGVRRCGRELRLVFVVGSAAGARELAIQPAEARLLALRVRVGHDARCTFTFRGPEGWVEAGEVQAKAGVWIGAKVGVFSIAERANHEPGHADFDYFRFAGD